MTGEAKQYIQCQLLCYMLTLNTVPVRVYSAFMAFTTHNYCKLCGCTIRSLVVEYIVDGCSCQWNQLHTSSIHDQGLQCPPTDTVHVLTCTVVRMVITLRYSASTHALTHCTYVGVLDNEVKNGSKYVLRQWRKHHLLRFYVAYDVVSYRL